MTEAGLNLVNTAAQKLEEELEELQEEIDELGNKRSRILNRFNELDSATRKRPPEVLCEIFEFAAFIPNVREPRLSFTKLETILTIGSTCSHWRRIAWSAPRLWTCALAPPTYFVPTEYIASLVTANSQSHSIPVRLDIHDVTLEMLSVLFDKHPQKISALRVYLSEDRTCSGHDMFAWEWLSARFNAMLNLSNLEELCIYDDTESYLQPGLIFHTPGSGDILRSDPYAGVPGPWKFPLHQLTVLHLENIAIDQCIRTLIHCPNLKEFHCVDPIPPQSRASYEPSILVPPSQRPLSLPNISTLSWNCCENEWNSFLSTSISFPCLRRLKWGVFVPTSPGEEQTIVLRLWNSFDTSFDALEALDLELAINRSPPNLLIPDIPGPRFASLQRLYIIAKTRESVTRWLEFLTWEVDDSRYPLPHLTTFHINIGRLSIREPRIFNVVQRFIRSRRSGPLIAGAWGSTKDEDIWKTHSRLETFILQSKKVPLEMEPYQMNILRSFVADGLTFEFVHRAKKDGGDYISILA